VAKTWFPHEDPLEDDEESQPILGPRYSPFWIFGTIVGLGLLAMVLYMSCTFIFSPVQR
jgi:hypothetical protein